MKDDSFIWTVGLGVFTLLVVGGAGLVAMGERLGTASERNRLYDKCLTEHESLPHKDAVAVCKERVK